MTIPSRDPADDGSLVGVLRHVLRKHLQNTDDMLPARVINFDRASNLVSVQPLISIVTTDGRTINRPQVAAIPALQIGGGNVLLAFNLAPGDLGWIKANDRDISLFLQYFRESPPNTKRLHSFSDAVFIPDVMTGFTIPSEDAAHATLQTKDGTQRFSVAPNYVKMTSGANSVLVNGSTVTATVGTTTLVITAAGITLTVGGTTMAMGGSGITTNGAWAHTGTITNNGVNIGSTHVHSGVQAGGSNTGAPV